MRLTSLLTKSLFFLGVAAATILAMIHFGLIDTASIRLAVDHGQNWLLLAFGLGLAATAINLWRYAKLLALLRVDLPLGSVAAATSVSLFVGQWLPGSMAISEMVRLGLMVGATKVPKANKVLHESWNTSQGHGGGAPAGELTTPDATSGIKARIFVASFLDRACGLVLFMTVGTTGCLVAIMDNVTQSAKPTTATHETTLLLALTSVGLLGVIALVALPWLAKHPAVLKTLERQSQMWLSTSRAGTKLFGQGIAALKRVTVPLASPDFNYRGFLSSLAISSLSSLALVGLFWACAKAVGFPMTYLQVAAVFPFLALAQLLPIGFGGIGGHQLVAVALFQAFSLDAKGVATVSLVAGIVPLVLNAVIGLFFLKTSATQVRAILKRAESGSPLATAEDAGHTQL